MACGGGGVVAGQLLHLAQLVEDVGLAGQVTDVAAQRQCLGQTGRSGWVISGQPGQHAEFTERDGLAGLVPCLACRSEGGPVQRSRLIHVAVGEQEAAYRSGDSHGVRVPPGRGGVVRGGVQVRALGFQPCGCLLEGGQPGGIRGRAGGGWEAVAGHRGEVLARHHGGVQVVVQQPPGRGARPGRVVRGSQGAGVLAEQIVQHVTARCGLVHQMLVIQFIEVPAGLVQAGAVEGAGGIGVDAWARDKAEAAEQPLPAGGEALVGQAECGRN